jgi:hypothetical protein
MILNQSILYAVIRLNEQTNYSHFFIQMMREGQARITCVSLMRMRAQGLSSNSQIVVVIHVTERMICSDHI